MKSLVIMAGHGLKYKRWYHTRVKIFPIESDEQIFMKDYYSIGEISKLYGVGTDSLRYYEETGALSPRRGENGYRMYSLKDIYRLNIIRDFLALGFSMKQIREYLDCQTLENTFDMLEREQEKIRERREELLRLERTLRERVRYIGECAEIKAGVFEQISCPRRFCLQLNEKITRDEEVDFAVKKLQKRYEHIIHGLGEQTIGASLLPEDLKNGIYNLFHSVFFAVEDSAGLEEGTDGVLVLPEGEYLTVCYRGSYRQSPERSLELMAEAKQRGLRPDGRILEWYLIDNRYTTRPEEFVTRLEMRVVPGSSAKEEEVS